MVGVLRRWTWPTWLPALSCEIETDVAFNTPLHWLCHGLDGPDHLRPCCRFRRLYSTAAVVPDRAWRPVTGGSMISTAPTRAERRLRGQSRGAGLNYQRRGNPEGRPPGGAYCSPRNGRGTNLTPAEPTPGVGPRPVRPTTDGLARLRGLRRSPTCTKRPTGDRIGCFVRR